MVATLSFIHLPASANDYGTAGWVNGFTVTNTVSVQQDGGIVVTATWTHSTAELLDFGSSTATGKLVLATRGPMFCNSGSAQSVNTAPFTIPATCIPQGSFPTTPPPVDVFTSGAGNTVTSTWTIPASNVANFDPSYGFFGLRYTWRDSNAQDRVVISPLVDIGSGISVASGASPEPLPAPAKYSGPEFSGLSAKGIMAGTSPRLEGKNLDEISSIEIGGKAATFTLDGDKALDLNLPSGLAPGLYDLVINSAAGKLTHINAIQVREPRRAFSITTRSEGRISEEQYQEHAIISSMQIPELNKVRCIVNGSNLAQAKAQAERLCALVAAANPNIETTVVESRSTVKNRTVYARVTYGWN